MFPRRITIRRLLTSRMHYLSYGSRAWRQLLSITSSLSTLFCCSSSPGTPHTYRKPSAESTNPDWSLCFFPAHLGDSQRNMHNLRTKKGPHAYPRVEAWPGFEGQFVRWDYPRCFLAIHRVPSVHGSPSLKFCYRRLNRSALRPRGICPNGLYSDDRPQPFTNPTCGHFPRGTLPGCLISQIRFDAWIGTPLGILISSRATPCFRSMRTSIVDTVLPHTRSIGMQSVPSPRSEPLHYKVKTGKLSLSLT